MSTTNGPGEKVAGVINFDISPAQRNLQVLSMSFRDFVEENSRTFELVGQVQLQAQERTSEQMANLTATQKARILQIEQDGDLKRSMATMAFNQQMEQNAEEHGRRLELIEQETQAAIEAMVQAQSLKLISTLQTAEARRDAIAKESSLRQLNISDKLFRDQEAHEERMTALRARSAREQLRLEEDNLKQFETMDKLHYYALQDDRNRDLQQQKDSISAQMREIKAFYDMKEMTAAQALARVEELLTVESEFFSQNEDKKLQLLKMGHSLRQSIEDQELAMDSLHYKALNENRQLDAAEQEADISRRMRNIKTFYDLELTTAKDALVQLKALMNEEYSFFETNESKKTQAMRMEYQLRGEIAKQNAGSGAGLDFGGLNTQVLNNVKSFAAGLAVINIVNELQKIPKTIMDVTGSVNKLKQVLELSDQIKSAQQLNDTVGQLQQVAERQAVIYGRDVSEVLNVMTEAGRRFKDVPSIIVATDNALQAMVADNVDAEKAIKGEEAMMAQFNLTLKDTREAWAKLTVASHEFMTDASSIIDGLERSGSAFKAMKMNTSEAIAGVVALSQESGRTGAVVGNSWKSIENTLGSKQGIQALHELGIEAKTDNGVLTDGLTILGKLQAKWPELSESSRAAFASTLAGGKYQYNQLLTFLDNTSGTFVRALDAMKKANVETQQELVKTAMESLPAQAKMTTAQLQVMAMSFSNVLTPAMMTFFMDMREGSKWIGEHANAIEHLIGTGMKLAEAYVAWRVGLKLYQAALESSTLATISAALANARLNISFGLLIAQRVGVVEGMKAIGASMLETAGTAAVAASRIAALVAVVSIFNSVAERKADPLAAKERDLENQIADLKQQKNSSPVGKVFEGAWSVFSSTWKSGFDPAAMDDAYTKTMGALSTNNYDAQIAKAQKELDDIRQQKKDRATKEFQDYQKMIDDAMKQATPIGPPPPSELPSGDLNIDPKPAKAPSAADFARPYRDMITQLEEELAPLQNISKNLDNVLEDVGTKQNMLNDRLKYGANDMSLASQNTQLYMQRLAALKTQQDALHITNDQVRADMAKVAEQIQALNPNNLPVTQLSQGQQDAIKALSDEYNKLSQQERDNSKKWLEDTRNMIQVTDEWTNAFIKLEDNAFTPLKRNIQEIDDELKTLKSEMSLDDNKMKHSDTSAATAADYAATYNAELDKMTQKENALKEERQQHEKAINDLTYALNSLDKSSVGYEAAVSDLTGAIDTHKSALADLSEQISQTEIDMQSLTDTATQKIADLLKAGYELEQQAEQRKLQDDHDAAVKSIQDKIDAVDELLKAEERQWQAEDDRNKLDELKKQRSDIMGQLDHVIVDENGQVKRTYDLEKVAELDKQIADQQTKIARDAEKQKLEDQKTALEKELKQENDAYTQKKQQLDDYWKYRLSQDQLNQEADRLKIKEGYGKALLDAQQFVNDMNKAFGQINWDGINAGGAIASGLGMTNAGGATSGASGKSLQDLIKSAGEAWQKASTQAEKDAIHKKLEDQLKGSGATYNSSTGEWSKDGKILNGSNAGQVVAAAATGAYIPETKEGLVYLHPNEVVANSPLVDNFKVVPPMLQELRSAMTQMPRLYAPAALAAAATQMHVTNSKQSTTQTVIHKHNTFHNTVYADDGNSVTRFLDLLDRA